MTDVTEYCDSSYKRLVGLKAGLYDLITQADEVQDSQHIEAAKKLKSIVASVEAGIEELKTQCPADWSPIKKDLDDKMARLTDTLNRMADDLGVVVPDTTAWI
jgi:hypothetical protein